MSNGDEQAGPVITADEARVIVSNVRAAPAGNPPDVIEVPRKAIDDLADHLIDANAASIQLNKAAMAITALRLTIAETFEAVRAAGGEHKDDCDCDRCVQARERNAVEPVGVPRGPQIVYDEGFRDGQRQAADDLKANDHANKYAEKLMALRSNIAHLYKTLGAAEGTCKACGASIWWVTTKNVRSAPFSAPFTAEGLNHFADCPKASRFRKKGKS